MACHIKTQFVPEIFNHPIWEDKIEIKQYSNSKLHSISVIAFNQDIWDTIVATNQANLKPFHTFRRTPTGNIEFSTSNIESYILRASETIRKNYSSAINPRAMATIHGFRDIRSAQANDKPDDKSDDQESEY